MSNEKTVIMEGIMDKKLSRPWGAQWVSRGVRLRENYLEVESIKGGTSETEREESSKRYKLNEIQLLEVQGTKGKHAFALAAASDPSDVKVTLCANTKFEHKRWFDAVQTAKKQLQERRLRRRTAVARPSDATDNEFTKPIRRPLSMSNHKPKSRRDIVGKDSLSSESGKIKLTAINEDGEIRQDENNDILQVTQNASKGKITKRTHESFEVTALESGLLGLKDNALVAHSSLPGVLPDDELVGCGQTLFLDDGDGIEIGAPLSLNLQQIESTLATVQYPQILIFRRRFHIASLSQDKEKKTKYHPDSLLAAKSRRLTMAEEEIVNAAELRIVNEPEPDEDLAKYERMLKVGAPAPAVMLKVRNELGEDAVLRLEERLGVENKSAHIKKSPPREKKDELEKYVRQSRRGVPTEAVFKKAKAEGLDTKKLERLAARIGLPLTQVAALHRSPPRTASKQLKYKGVHWEPHNLHEEKRGSLWHRKTKDRRESMGARAESLFDNEEALDFLDTVMGANHTQNSSTPIARSLTQSPAETTPKSDVPLEILDHQRALGLQVALNQIRKDLKLRTASERALCVVIIAHSDCISSDAIRALLSALPTPEEFTILKENTKNHAQDQRYTPATKFGLAILQFFASQAQFSSFLRASLTLAELEDDAAGACDRARAVARACRHIRKSKELRAALLSALTLGNKLNADTRRGNAHAIKLLDLERLDHTRGKDGMTAFDVLAKVMHIDKARGDEGLDAESIDNELRALVPLLRDTDAGPDHTFDVANTLKKQIQHLRTHFLNQQDLTDEQDDPAANARQDFVQRCRAKILGLEAAIVTLDAVLDNLHRQQIRLADYCSDLETPTKLIFEALLAFCNKLIFARQKLISGGA